MTALRLDKSIARLCLATLLCLHSALNSFGAGKQKPAPSNGSLEVSISGAIFTLPDHTSNADEVAPLYSYDLCRSVKLSDNAVAFRKATMYLPFEGACSGDGFDGPGFYTRAVGLIFSSSSAPQGSAVTFQLWVAHNYVVTAVGTIESGKWPPAAVDNLATPAWDERNTRLKFAAGTLWKFNTYGGWSKSCRVSFNNLDEVVVDLTRNDSMHTTDPCDCPFDYDDDAGGTFGTCDPDGDAIVRADNCPFLFNPGQEDINGNGVGDACE